MASAIKRKADFIELARCSNAFGTLEINPANGFC
jgi:hypothetical protein